jgi:CHAD domain-containing protein
MTAIDGFRIVLRELHNTIEANRESAIEGTDPESLHDFRVAVRRTRSVLSQGKSVLPQAIGAEARQQFAWLAAQTGQPRDLDVLQINWLGYTSLMAEDDLKALEPVCELIEGRRHHAYVSLKSSLRSDTCGDFLSSWSDWLGGSQCSAYGPKAHHSLGEIVAHKITRLQTTIVEHGSVIHPRSPVEEVHALRKEAKKLRYLLDCFASLWPTNPHAQVTGPLKVLQENLGNHQDAVVHSEDLRRMAATFMAQGHRPIRC